MGGMKLRRVMIVEWIDSSLQNGQVDRFDYPVPVLVTSVGFLVEDTKTHVTLARDDMKDDEFRGLICIPVECIRKKTELVKKSKKR